MYCNCIQIYSQNFLLFLLNCALVFQEYPTEDASITDPENKAYLKFLHSTTDHLHIDKKAQPGYNFDVYFDGLMSRCGLVASNFFSVY